MNPWDNEPDHLEFEAHGLPCVIHRVIHDGCRKRHLCGYVGVTHGHPLHGIAYSTVARHLQEFCKDRKEPIGDAPPCGAMLAAMCGFEVMQTPEGAFAVHGGITFSKGRAPGCDTKGLWWFGFDCAHCDDMVPSDDDSFFSNRGTYRTMKYVKSECERLADQLSAFSEFVAALAKLAPSDGGEGNPQ